MLSLAGLALLMTGLLWIYPPIALVGGGAVIFGLGCCGAINARRDRELAKFRARLKRRRDERRRIEDEEAGD